MLAPNAARRKILRIMAGGFLSLFALVSLLCFFYLSTIWTNAAPRSPDVREGLVYPHNNLGTMVYFSAFQTTACSLLFGLSPLLLFLGLSIAPIKNVRSRMGRFSFDVRWNWDDPSRVLPWACLAGAVAAPPAVFLLGPPIVRVLNQAGFVLSLL